MAEYVKTINKLQEEVCAIKPARNLSKASMVQVLTCQIASESPKGRSDYTVERLKKQVVQADQAIHERNLCNR